MTNKEKYREFCKIEKDIPIFSKDWWLDCVCGKNNWNVALVEKGGYIVASMPYLQKKRSIFTIISMPKSTQNLGPYIKYPSNQKYYKKLSYEKDIMFSLIENLPQYNYFIQNFHYNINNWLPFYWKGFNQTTKYTYVIENTENIDLIVSNFSKNNRQLFNRGIESLRIVDDLSIEEFYKVCELTFKRQNIKIPYSLDFLKKIYITVKENNSGKALFAVDNENNIHSVSLIVWDDNSVYSIIGGGDPKLRNSGAKNLIFFKAIKIAQEKKIKFDFEGSMIESIENFYRSFGAIQKPYFTISKTNSKLLKIRNFIMDLKQ